MAQQQDSDTTAAEKTPKQGVPADLDQLQRQLEQLVVPKRTEDTQANSAGDDGSP
jgi:hypothetical protein